MTDLFELTATELRSGYLSGAFSPVEVFRSVAARIAAAEPVVGAFTTLCLDRAEAEATAAAQAYAAGTAREFEGVPFAAKDLFDSEGVRTTYGSAMFRDHVPARDATAVAALRGAGAILVGKTQTHEFAWGITSINEQVGSPRNPWARERITGGSSGGSGAALAAREVPLALGSDTGGSIRIPAAFCGVTGIKPTFGAVSTEGVFPLAPSLDHAGLMARDPGDLAAALRVISGSRPAGPAGGEGAGAGARLQRPGGQPLRVGVCAGLAEVPLGDAAADALTAVRDILARVGAEVSEVDFPEAPSVTEAYGLVQLAEGLDVHRRLGLYPSRAPEYGADVRRHLEAAGEVDLGRYLHGQRLRGAIAARFLRLFTSVDVLLTPASPVTAPRFTDEKVEHLGERYPLRSLVMPFMTPHDLAGIPSVAVRAGFDADGLPVAVQLAGPRGSDELVLRAGAALFEATADVQERWPTL